jgi:hypothetical protein
MIRGEIARCLISMILIFENKNKKRNAYMIDDVKDDTWRDLFHMINLDFNNFNDTKESVIRTLKYLRNARMNLAHMMEWESELVTQ